MIERSARCFGITWAVGRRWRKRRYFLNLMWEDEEGFSRQGWEWGWLFLACEKACRIETDGLSKNSRSFQVTRIWGEGDERWSCTGEENHLFWKSFKSFNHAWVTWLIFSVRKCHSGGWHEGRESSWETAALLQAGDVGGLKQRGQWDGGST